MSTVEVKVTREFLEDLLRCAPFQPALVVDFHAKVDDHRAILSGHVACDPSDDTFSFAFEVPAQ